MQTIEEFKNHYKMVRQRITSSTHQEKIEDQKKDAHIIDAPTREELEEQAYRKMRQSVDQTFASLFLPGKSKVSEIAKKYNLPVSVIISASRERRLVGSRHEIMWELRQLGMSFPRIGMILGGRDHTTCLHGVRKYQKRLAAMKASEAS